MTKTIAQYTAEIRENNIRKGFRPADGGPGGNTWGDYIALLHSEISEALEAYRDHRLADATNPLSSVRWGSGELPKPEGVGSELADVAIRLLDMCDVFGISPSGYERFADIRDAGTLLPVRSFGDHMAWLHCVVTEAWERREHVGLILRVLLTVARKYGIDLDAEMDRKIAFNATRPYQHGGRTLADGVMQAPVTRNMRKGELTPAERMKQLYEATPTDPRGWWTGHEVDEFIDAWRRLELPELVIQGAEGDQLILWCTDVRRACEMLGAEMGNDEGFTLLNSSDYEVGIRQAEKKETKDA